MGNLVMDQLLPSLEKDMLPRLKAKKTEKKRVWFAVSHTDTANAASWHKKSILTSISTSCDTHRFNQSHLNSYVMH